MSDPPAWLASLLGALRDGHDPATVADWSRRVHGELDRLGGRVPFQVVHDWHAHVVPASDGADGPDLALGELHRRALAGEQVEAVRWSDALRPALRELYRAAYPYAEARAVAYANAHAYATANGFPADEVVEYADYYADLSTGANVVAYADANAIANAGAIGAALAAADGQAYARTYPAALLRAHVSAYANRVGAGAALDAMRSAYGRLAQALLDALGRVTV